MLHPDQPFVGRALTAAYLPSRPDLVEHVTQVGKAEGRIGRSNSWPIDMLQKGDVYVADGFGKVIDGTLIGDNLGNAIYAKSGTGVVFHAGARDVEGLREIKGFNAFVRGWDPSEIKNMVLASINRPIRIGRAVVLPGDVILARRGGVVVIPAQLAEEVVVTSEIIGLKDEFGHMRLKEGVYTPGQIDSPWTEPIKADFFKWLKLRKNNPPIPLKEIENRPANRRTCEPRYYVLARIARIRSATMASSPGSIIQTPMTSCRPLPGLTSMLGLPSRSCRAMSAELSFRRW
jgi:regulator of RNase E activity RraA